MKICGGCKTNKENEEFSKDKNRVTGLRSWCKVCSNLDSKKYRDGNEDLKRKKREYYHLNKESMRRKMFNKILNK